MSEFGTFENKTESHCCSKSLRNVLSKNPSTISVGTIKNDSGPIYIGATNIQATTTISNEAQPKLMFQVKSPIHTFTGREKFLEDLHDSIQIQNCRSEGSTVSIISQASSIIGLGGIGKSETVRMYIHKYGDEYDNVVWIDAEKPSEAKEQFRSLALFELNLAINDQNGNPREFFHILENVYRKLCQKPKRLLLVFDNAEALDLDVDVFETQTSGIRQFLPQQTKTIEPPVILITSRQHFWEDLNVISLGLWEMEECVEFIYKRLKLRDTPENRKDATELAELFDRLPIAIEVGASVIAEQLRKRKVGGTRVYRINNLIEEYKAGDRKMLSKKTQQNSTQVTMQLLLNVSLDKIKAYDEGTLAIKILAFMAYLSPTGIPKKMIHALMHEIDEEERDSALTLLTEYSIIQSHAKHFTIHRVFQDIVITILPTLSLQLQTISASDDCVEEDTDEIKVLNEITRRLLDYASQSQLYEHETHEDYNGVVTNMLHVTDCILEKSLISNFYDPIENTARLIEKTHFEASIKLYRELINFDKSKKEKSDSKICDNLETIAFIYFHNGLYGKALETFNEQLTEQLSTCADEKNDHESKKKEVLRIRMNIALCLDNQGKHEEALQLNFILERDLGKVFGPLHPHTLNIKMNLANSLFVKGNIDEALQLYYIVEKDQENALGPLHPDTLRTKMNIARCLSDKGKIDQALLLSYNLKRDQEKALGPLHPHTLTTKINIASTLCVKGNIDEALQLYCIVEKDQEKVLGPLHPETLKTKVKIANSLYVKGKIYEALERYYVVEKDQEKALGPLHPQTLATKMNLANCLSKVGKEEEALRRNFLLQEYQVEILGPLHTETLLTKMNIANSLSGLGRKKDALELYSAVLDDQENARGPLDYSSLITVSNKAVCVAEMGNWENALKVFRILEKEQEKVYSCLYPNTLITKMHIANCLSDLGNTEEAMMVYDAVEKDMEKALGPLHPHILLTKMNKAILLSDLGKKEKSFNLYQCVLEEQEKLYGPLFPYTLVTKMNTAVCLSALGKKEDALKHYYEVKEQQEKVLGPEHPYTLATNKNISNHLSEEGKKEEYLRLYYVD